jgi:hypothetical protein
MHDLNEWKNREGELMGASIFLTAKEIEEVRENGKIEIEIRQ